MTQTRPRAFAVWFQDLATWSVAAQFSVNWNWPDEIIKSLNRVISRRREAAIDTLSPETIVTLLTIRFDGSIEPRKSVQIKDIKGKLYRVYPGDVVFSKIDVRNGAIGIAPDDIECMCVSSEFPVYSVSTGKALSGYVKLLFRTTAFKKLLNSMISGTSGRKRIQPSQLEGVKVPLPPLPVQQKIVAYWEAATAEVSQLKDQAKAIIDKSTHTFIHELGISPPKKQELEKVFVTQWEAFDRWGVSYNQAAKTMLDLSKGKFPVVELGSILELVQYGTSEKTNSSGGGVGVIRMTNIVDGDLDLSNMKYLKVSKDVEGRLKLLDGDILINRTNSKELVGKCAVFDKNETYIFASYLIRLQVNAEKSDPHFITFVINSTIGRQQINALSRQIIGQANINSQEIRSLKIPLPPLSLQKELAQGINYAHQEAALLERGAKDRLEKATIGIEQMILGTRPVEAH